MLRETSMKRIEAAGVRSVGPEFKYPSGYLGLGNVGRLYDAPGGQTEYEDGQAQRYHESNFL
jgi:hypothetical protein